MPKLPTLEETQVPDSWKVWFVEKGAQQWTCIAVFQKNGDAHRFKGLLPNHVEQAHITRHQTTSMRFVEEKA